MKWKLTLLLAIIIGGLAGSWIKNLPGFVIIAYEKTSYEMRLWVAVTFILIALSLLALIGMLFRSLFAGAGKIKGWHGGRHWRRSRKKTVEGMLAFTEGRWKAAEDAMVNAAKVSDSKLINYLVAAQAAQHQNAEVRRDAYLRLAHQSEPAAKVAIGLTQAQLQLKHNQLEQALASLKDLKRSNPNHPYVLKLLSKLYEKLNEWEKILPLLPSLKKQSAFSIEEFEVIEVKCIAGILNQYALNNNVEAMKDCWSKMPGNIRKNATHILCYCRHLVRFEQWDESEQLLKSMIKKSANAEMLNLYGLVQSSNPERQLSFMESWLSSESNPAKEAYLTLGRLAFQCELWGKSRQYLEKSLHLKPSADGFILMAETLEKLGEFDQASECYRQGLTFVVGATHAPAKIALQQGSDDLINADLLPKFQKVEP